MPKINTLEDYKNANKNYCKTYYNKKKNNLNNLKQENINLKQINDNLKQENALLIKELTDIKDMLDNEEESDNDTEAEADEDDEDIYNNTDEEEALNYDELYDELATRTKNFNLVFIKDYERHMNPKLLKYQYLFIENINDITLDDRRFEWMKNMKAFLDDDNTEYEEYEEVGYHNPLFI